MTKDHVLDRDGNAVTLEMTPNFDIEVKPWDEHPRDEPWPWERQLVGIQSVTLEAPDQCAYDARMGLTSKKYLTMIRPSDARWIIDRVREQIAGKVVVELGAGIGVMAIALAAHAKRVFAIEVDPMWSWAFSRFLYREKPANLTFVLDRAENLVDVIRADVALVVTGSAEVELRALAERFAPVVIMPWQDWNDGKAVTRWRCW